MSTQQQIRDAITRIEQDIREMTALHSSVSDQRHLLASLTGQQSIAPGPELQARIALCLKRIEEGIAARDQLALKKAALKSLQDELADKVAVTRREQCEDLKAQFNRTKDYYKEQSEALLITFRRLYALNREYVSLTNYELLSEQDFKLELPVLRRPEWVSPFTTAQEIRF